MVHEHAFRISLFKLHTISRMQQRRIAKEWQTLIAKPVAPNVTVHENKDDATNTSWRVHYTGLPYTHYAGAVFRINVGTWVLLKIA